MPSEGLMCPTWSAAKLKVEPYEENGETAFRCEDEKVIDLHLKSSVKQRAGDELIKSAPLKIAKIENEKEELDQKESDLCFKESLYIKCETRTFQEKKVKSTDGNIEKEFDNDVLEPCAIKKETDAVNERASGELYYCHESPFKSEVIEQEEVQIKHEEDNEHTLNKKYKFSFQPGTTQQEDVHSKSKGDKKEKQHKKIRKLRNRSVLHQCSECLYGTIRKYDLKRHSVMHKKPDEIHWYNCQKCPYKTFRKSHLKAHGEIHNTSMLKCSKCSYETLTTSNLKKHQIKHKTNIQWLHCSECSFKTHQPSLLPIHYSLVHKSHIFKCPNCVYQTAKKELFTIHQIKHEGMDKWHPCPLCPYKTYNKNTLRKHCLRQHSTDPRYNSKQIEIFKCTKCFYETGCKNNVKMHQLIHNQSSWFQCSDCAYRTPYKSNLKKHQVRHQGENAKGWHRCPKCPYKTLEKSNLRYHDISHKPADEIRLFECSQCSFKTAHKDSVRRHQLKHKETEEIELFFCYECSFRTKYKASLPKHMLKHKKTKPQKF